MRLQKQTHVEFSLGGPSLTPTFLHHLQPFLKHGSSLTHFPAWAAHNLGCLCGFGGGLSLLTWIRGHSHRAALLAE